MESSYRTTVDPGGELDLLRRTTSVHPYFAAGGPLALVGRIPLGQQFDIFGKVGGWYWQNTDVSAEIVSGSTGKVTIDKDGTDILYGVGVGFDLTNGWKVRGEFEHYAVDKWDVDFFTFSVEKHFPKK